jgi:DNA modification methylase
MALALIFSKYVIEKSYPTIDELKETVGFSTDRMLDITLKALEVKGFLEYNGNLEYILRDDVIHLQSLFVDPLLLIHKYTKFSEFKKKIPLKSVSNFSNQLSQSSLESYNKEHLSSYLERLNNETLVFHRWYTYLADYPPSFVLAKIKEFDIKKESVVLDPFCGSGTTLVTSNLLGINAIGIDANPVPVFVSKVKTNWNVDINEFKRISSSLLTTLTNAAPALKSYRIENELIERMGHFELNQWLKPKTQSEVIFVKNLINEYKDQDLKDLLKLALIESAIESSNVCFCPGTSFYPFRKRPDFPHAFSLKIQSIIQDLTAIKQLDLDTGTTRTFNNDCRLSSQLLGYESIDFIITSPPYPNDMEYTRQTRLDLFLLDYVKDMTDVQLIKRKMVKGSTKLIFKESNSEAYVKDFKSIQDISNMVSVALDDKKWGWDYPRMIREYFGDMYLCLKDFKSVIKPNGHILLVVGDQTYKNIIIPVGKILAEMAESLGYSDIKIELFRIRKSSLHNIPLNEEVLVLGT